MSTGLHLLTWNVDAITSTQKSQFTFLDVVVSKCATVLQLLASKDQTLLVRGDTCATDLVLSALQRLMSFL